MSKAGLAAAPARSRFIATEAGRRTLAENPARIDAAFLMREPAFRAFYRNEDAAGDAGAPDDHELPPPEAISAPRETPQDRIQTAHQAI